MATILKQKYSNLAIFSDGVSYTHLFHFRSIIKLFVKFCDRYYLGDEFYDTEDKYQKHFAYCYNNFFKEFSNADVMLRKWVSSDGFTTYIREFFAKYIKHIYYAEKEKESIQSIFKKIDSFFNPYKMLSEEHLAISNCLKRLY